MANKKFSEFELKTTTSNVSHVVGYDGVENVRITPANFLDTTGGPYLPLAGGTMTGTNGVVFPDNFYLNLGTSSDFEIYHDGNNSYLKDQGTGELILASNGTGIKLEKTSGEKMIHALTDGAVELYYDSVKKFETTLLGATVTGDLLVTGTITGVGGSYLPLAGGTLTGALTGTSATFSGHLQAENRLTLTDAVAGATRYVITDETNTGTGSLVLQAGGGSAAYGGALGMYAHSHASKPGDVFAGISSASGGSFRVNTTGIDSGLDLLTINNTVAIFSPGSSEKMRLDASGNLGLGVVPPTTSVYPQLFIGAQGVIMGSGGTNIGDNVYYNGGWKYRTTGEGSLTVQDNGTIKFYTTPSGIAGDAVAFAERMSIENSGNTTFGGTVRINGTTTTGLVIASSSSASSGLKLYNNSSTDNAYIYNHYNGNLEIGTNNATVLTMDGTSSTFAGNITSTAASFLQSFNVTDNSTFFNINHTGNESWAFKCESIGGGAADFITIGTSAGKVAFGEDGGAIFEGSITATGGVYLGGTAAGNKLDDYEEGDWTPALGGTWTTDPTGLSGRYVKVGSTVTIYLRFTDGSKISSTSGYFTGLPFNTNYQGTGSVSDSGVNDKGNCLFANTDRVWLTDTSFSSTNYVNGTYITND